LLHRLFLLFLLLLLLRLLLRLLLLLLLLLKVRSALHEWEQVDNSIDELPCR
jgi:hypothetical protein